MTTLWQDVVYGLRMLAKRPLFTAVAALSLALGIGLNTAIFTLINTILWGSLSFREPERLAVIWSVPPGQPDQLNGLSVPDYLAFKERSKSFEVIGAMNNAQSEFGAGENGAPAELVRGEALAPEMLRALRVQPLMGRLFTPQALGAGGRDVLRLVFRQVAWMIVAGLAIGIGGAAVLTRFISSQLWEVQATDPGTYAGVSALLVAVAMLACVAPTRRAVQVDPTI